jgi:VWA domain-containing protein
VPGLSTIAMSFSLFHPWWLAALVFAAWPVLAASRCRRRGRPIGAWATGLRCLAVGAVVVALADPAVRLPKQATKPFLFFRDVSGSVRGQHEDTVAWPEDLPREIVLFADGLGVGKHRPGETQTRLDEALRLAVSRSDRIAGVVIQTDGRFQDDWASTARELGELGTDVLILPLESPCVDARVAGIDAVRLPAGEVRVRASLQANASRSRIVRIQRIGRAGEQNADLLTREELLVGPTTLVVSDTSPGDGVVQYRASLLPPDELPENDSLSVALVPSGGQVAVVAVDEEASAALNPLTMPSEALAPGEAPRDMAGWLPYSAVLLVDPFGDLLDVDQRGALAQYVRSGGGLVLMGAGPHRSPADRQDPLNAAAALVANPYERQPVQVTVVLDASGSMAEMDLGAGEGGQRVKFEVATEATLALRRHLTPEDSLVVIAFADETKRIYDSRAGRPDFSALREALEGVRPAGATDIRPALKEAVRQPAPEAKIGLVLVLSDLATQPFDSSEVSDWIRDSGHRLAIVAVRGLSAESGESPELELLALRLGAPIRRTRSLVGLAETFADLISETRGETILQGEYGLGSGRPFGVSASTLSPLSAYVPCAAWPDAEVVLEVSGDPFIARRRVGAGRSASFALACGKGLDTTWPKSPGADRLLDAAVAWCARPTGEGRFLGTLTRRAGGMHLALEAAEGAEDVDLLELVLDVHPLAGGDPRTVTLRQDGPGNYSATFPASDEPCTLVVRHPGQGIVWQRTLGEDYAIEFGQTGADWDALRELAEASGGRVISQVQMHAELTRGLRLGYAHFWPWLVGLGVAAMLLEWVLSRR